MQNIYAAWERGDYSSVEWADPEIEFVIADGPDPGSWTGLAGLAQGWGDFLNTWAGFRNMVDEYRKLDGEDVLVLSRFSGRGKTSGLPVGHFRERAATLVQVRGGTVTRLVLYWDLERALADLGLA